MNEELMTAVKKVYETLDYNAISLEGYSFSCDGCPFAKKCHDLCSEGECESYVGSQVATFTEYILEYLKDNNEYMYDRLLEVADSEEYFDYCRDLLNL